MTLNNKNVINNFLQVHDNDTEKSGSTDSPSDL